MKQWVSLCIAQCANKQKGQIQFQVALIDSPSTNWIWLIHRLLWLMKDRSKHRLCANKICLMSSQHLVNNLARPAGKCRNNFLEMFKRSWKSFVFVWKMLADLLFWWSHQFWHTGLLLSDYGALTEFEIKLCEMSELIAPQPIGRKRRKYVLKQLSGN